MKAVDSKSGFSVLELMVAMLATAILALTVGSMLYFGYLGWHRNNDSVNMQRDASLAMRVIAREIRQTPINNITGGNTLRCVNSGGTTTFSVSGGDLVHAVDGNTLMLLVRDWVSYFNTQKNTDGRSVTVMLNLDTGTDTSVIEETIFTRN